MEKDKFEKAKMIRDKIDHMSVKKNQIEKMRERENDTEFNLARQLAHDGICYVIQHMESDFKAL